MTFLAVIGAYAERLEASDGQLYLSGLDESLGDQVGGQRSS